LAGELYRQGPHRYQQAGGKKTLSVLTFEKSEERHATQKAALRACAETNEWED